MGSRTREAPALRKARGWGSEEVELSQWRRKGLFPRLFSDQGVESLATFPEGHNRRQAAGIVGEGEN